MGKEITNIYDDKKIIGKEIECDCGCRRFLKAFDDMDNDKVELVLVTALSHPVDEQWKKNFIITKENLRLLIGDEDE